MGITRVSEVTVADVWADDDGGVTVEVAGAKVSLSPDEATVFADAVCRAAVDAWEALREKADGEAVLRELTARQSHVRPARHAAVQDVI